MLSISLEKKFISMIEEKINSNPDQLRNYIKKCSKKSLVKLIDYIDNNYCYSKSDLMNTIKYSLNILD